MVFCDGFVVEPESERTRPSLTLRFARRRKKSEGIEELEEERTDDDDDFLADTLTLDHRNTTLKMSKEPLKTIPRLVELPERIPESVLESEFRAGICPMQTSTVRSSYVSVLRPLIRSVNPFCPLRASGCVFQNRKSRYVTTFRCLNKRCDVNVTCYVSDPGGLLTLRFRNGVGADDRVRVHHPEEDAVLYFREKERNRHRRPEMAEMSVAQLAKEMKISTGVASNYLTEIRKKEAAEKEKRVPLLTFPTLVDLPDLLGPDLVTSTLIPGVVVFPAPHSNGNNKYVLDQATSEEFDDRVRRAIRGLNDHCQFHRKADVRYVQKYCLFSGNYVCQVPGCDLFLRVRVKGRAGSLRLWFNNKSVTEHHEQVHVYHGKEDGAEDSSLTEALNSIKEDNSEENY